MIRFLNVTNFYQGILIIFLFCIFTGILYYKLLSKINVFKKICLISLRVLWTGILIFFILHPVTEKFLPINYKHLTILIDYSYSMKIAEKHKSRFETALDITKKITNKLDSFWKTNTLFFSDKIYDSSEQTGFNVNSNIISSINNITGNLNNNDAILLLTDGNNSNPVFNINSVINKHIKVYSIYPEIKNYKELRIIKVDYKNTVQINNESHIKVKVAGAGKFKLILKHKKKILNSLQINKIDNVKDYVLKYIPEKIGNYELTVEIQNSGDNEIFYDDNIYKIIQNVIQSNKKQIVLLWNSPSWDIKIIEQTVKQYSNIDFKLVYSKDFSDINSSCGIKNADKVDAVILINVPSSSINLQCQNKLVNSIKNGLGIVMIGGKYSFGEGGWSSTPLSKVFPVEFNANDTKLVKRNFNPILNKLSKNEILSENFSALRINEIKLTYNKIFGTKSNIEYCVKIKDTGNTADKKNNIIGLAKGFYGKGNVIAVNVSDLWKLFYITDNYCNNLQKFWISIIHNLFTNDDRKIDIQFNNTWKKTNSFINIIVNSKLKNNNLKWNFIGPDTNKTGAIKAKAETVKLFLEHNGVYYFNVNSIDNKNIKSSVIINVSDTACEMLKLKSDVSFLNNISNLTNGLCVPYSEFEKIIKQLNQNFDASSTVKQIDFWDNKWWLIILVILITLEWVLRKKLNLK